MRDKVKQFIEESKALSLKKKNDYLKIIRFIPDENLGEFLKIPENEQKEASRLTEAEKIDEAEFYQNSLLRFEQVYKGAYTKAVSGEEAADKEEAEHLLNNLDL